jgi:hypothetical protein
MTVRLSSTDDAGVAGLERTLIPGSKLPALDRRSVRPIQLQKCRTLRWRAVD